MSGVAKRSYGTGRLYVVIDRGGRASWYGSWWAGSTRVKRKIGLKRSTGNADGLTRTQAERELRRLVDATTVVAKGQRRTVGEAGDAYVAHLENVMERKRTTIADYRGYLRRHLAPFFGDRPTDRIESGQVERYLHAKRGDGLSPKTIQNHLNFLHGIFAFAVRRGWATTNPVALVERPRAHRSAHRRIRFLQPEELEAAIRAVPADALGAVERPLYLTAAMTGLRQGELLALRWSDVDWSASRVRVAESFTRGAFDSPKSHRGRSVPMADRLAAELERHFQRSHWRRDHDLVFAHPATGHVLDASKLRQRFRTALARAGAPDLTFHELRHTFGTQMAAAGAPLRAVQEWMGHADASTTEIYAHYAPDPTGGAAFAQRAFGSGASAEPLPGAVSGMPQPRALP
jgi:integrase